MAVFLSSFFGKSLLATTVVYVLVVLEFILAPLLPNLLASWPVIALLFPPVAFVRGAMLVWNPPELLPGELSLPQVLLCLYGSGTCLLLLGIGLHSTERWSDLPGAVWSCLGQVLPAAGRSRSGEGELLQSILSLADGDRRGQREEDADVAAERERLAADPAAGCSGILTRDLVKEYGSGTSGGGGGKRAVDRLSLGADVGECLGLLGPNGAGKTTTLSILSGCVLATSGEASVGGFSVERERSQVHRVLGVCPQFDTVWEGLSVRQHLLLYTRLKGHPIDRERIVAQQVSITP